MTLAEIIKIWAGKNNGVEIIYPSGRTPSLRKLLPDMKSKHIATIEKDRITTEFLNFSPWIPPESPVVIGVTKKKILACDPYFFVKLRALIDEYGEELEAQREFEDAFEIYLKRKGL